MKRLIVLQGLDLFAGSRQVRWKGGSWTSPVELSLPHQSHEPPLVLVAIASTGVRQRAGTRLRLMQQGQGE